jgi:hypothetical protein
MTAKTRVDDVELNQNHASRGVTTQVKLTSEG